MTNKDIFIQMISEATGSPPEEAEEVFRMIEPMLPDSHKMNTDLTDEAARELLEALREEKDGIRQWVEEGRKRMESRAGHA